MLLQSWKSDNYIRRIKEANKCKKKGSDSKSRNLFIWKHQIFLYAQNTHFILYSPYPFCAHFERYTLSLKICIKRVGIINNFGHTRNFAFIKHRQKNVRIPNEKLFCGGKGSQVDKKITSHWDATFIFKNAQKGVEQWNKSCLRASRLMIYPCKSSNPIGFWEAGLRYGVRITTGFREGEPALPSPFYLLLISHRTIHPQTNMRSHIKWFYLSCKYMV